jgi:hypothetical protein
MDAFQDCDIIFWDEITMFHFAIIGGIDNLMRKAKGVPNKPFGVCVCVCVCVVVFPGDFRQCLPIVVGRAPLSETVERCILSAEFEPEVNFLTTTENMRILSAEVSREETLVLRQQADRCMSILLKKIFPIGQLYPK